MTEKSVLPEATERSLHILKKQIPAWGEYLLAQRGLSMRTVVSYRQDLENFFLFLDELDAGDKTSLDEHDLFLYLAWLRARKNAGRTLARRLSALRGFFEYTVEEGLLESNPASLLESPRLPQYLPEVLSKAEMDRFIGSLIQIKRECEAIAGQADNVVANAPHTAFEIAGEWTHPYSREEAAFPLEWVRTSKFFPYVTKIDNGYGDRNLVCRNEE